MKFPNGKNHLDKKRKRNATGSKTQTSKFQSKFIFESAMWHRKFKTLTLKISDKSNKLSFYLVSITWAILGSPVMLGQFLKDLAASDCD